MSRQAIEVLLIALIMAGYPHSAVTQSPTALLLATDASPTQASDQSSAPSTATPPAITSVESDPNTALSLADLEKIALESNPTIDGAAALVVQQQGLQRQSTLYPNPTAGYVRTDPNQSGQSATQGVFLSQDIVTAGKRRLAGEAEGQEVEWRVWQVEAQRQRVLNDVRIRYFELLGAQQTVEATKELEQIAMKGVETANALLRGKVTAPGRPHE